MRRMQGYLEVAVADCNALEDAGVDDSSPAAEGQLFLSFASFVAGARAVLAQDLFPDMVTE